MATDARVSGRTVLAVAVMDALRSGADLEQKMHEWGRSYPEKRYLGGITQWLETEWAGARTEEDHPWGAMLGAIGGAWGRTQEEALDWGGQIGDAIHGHEHVRDGARAVALAVWQARQGANDTTIAGEVARETGLQIYGSTDDMEAEEMGGCRMTVPGAIACGLDRKGIEMGIRWAIRLGGDAGAQCAIAACVAQAREQTPYWIRERGYNALDNRMQQEVLAFERAVEERTDGPA